MATIEWPLQSISIVRGFSAGSHTGIDLVGSTGTPVYATDDGVVDASGGQYDYRIIGGGIFVLLQHSWGMSGYAHLSGYTVTVGQAVTRGQLIGFVGSTGNSTGPHLHWETMPLSPNWNSPSFGRVDPYTHTIVPHGTTPSTPVTPVDDEEEDMTLYARPTGNSSPINPSDPNSFRIWAGDNRSLYATNFSGTWEIKDGRVRRLSMAEWAAVQSAYSVIGRTAPVATISGNDLEIIAFGAKAEA